MNRTNLQLVLFFVLLIRQYPVFGQDLTGKWYWENDEMRAEVYFSDDKYFMEAFIKNTNSQISEGFSYYMLRGDTLIFNKIPASEGREPLAYHYIENITDEKMTLIDLRNNEKNDYFNVNKNYYPLAKYRIHEFYNGGGTNVCVSDVAEADNNPCLNFGSISVNSSVEEIEQILGKPFDEMEQAGRYYKIYLLKTLEDGSQPYFALELNNNQIKSIQISGSGSVEPLSFSSISLGDYYTFVEQKLGKPSEVGFVDDETEHWSYAPFSFSFEIRNNFVHSIKMNKP